MNIAHGGVRGQGTAAAVPSDPRGSALARPITANVLTGFLGSGKTSLLRRLLAADELARAAVLINELGEVGIDHLLVEALDEEVVLLKSGCVCCSIRGDLKAAILGLYGRMQRGEIAAFDRIVIETTGLADPGPIVATFRADPVLQHHFRLGNIVTVADAVAGARNLDHFFEAQRQVAVADRVVISKIDLALAGRVAALSRQISRLNPTASILESSEASPVPPDLLLADLYAEGAREREVALWLAAEGVGGREPAEHAGVGAGAEAHAAHAAVRAFCIIHEAPLDWARFGLWLSMLLNRHGSDILRVKGLLNVAGVAAPVVIQGVQHSIHAPEHLAAWPDGDTRTRIVFIASGLDAAHVARSFRAFHR
jgi:G3E family GTPase